MATIKIESLDLDGLIALKKDVETRIKAKQAEYRDGIKAQIRDLMAKADLTPADLGSRTRAGTGTVKPKYQSKDGSNTWSGRGRKPKWVEAHLSQGGSLEDLLI